MILLGPIVNALTVLAGGTIGLLLRGRLPQHVSASMLKVMGICTMVLGIQNALKSNDFLMLILCATLGTMMGELLRIEDRLNRMGAWIEGRVKGGSGQIAQGLVTASLLFCVGAMTIVGSLESGLSGDHATLYVKSLMDGITSILLASTLGPGVLLAGLPVLLIQGGIALSAGWVAPWISEPIINGISAVGGLSIVCIGANLAGLGNEKLRVANMLPSLVLPVLYIALKGILA